ncbi:MAG: preprotein translocase subunit SecE [Proteobacteria bacterium]|nr:preprotein translocase subunit SecE [Pseudomonadota bacterium]
MQRSQKAVSLIYLACGAVAWLLFREIFATAWVLARLPMPADWIVSPVDMLSAAIGLATFVALLRSSRVGAFTNEVITELGKVTWPNKKETVLSTGVVSVLVGICAVILFGFDMLWGMLVKVFYQ